MKKKRLRLHEVFSGKPVIQETGKTNLITNCKLLGIDSENGRKYLPDAIKKAKSKYEGKSVFFDHPDIDETGNPKSRPWHTRFGHVENVRDCPDGIYGDLRFNEKHHLAEQFIGWVNMGARGGGFSHSATGLIEEKDGVDWVVEITDVESVDLVGIPATTKSLYESIEMDKEDELKKSNEDETTDAAIAKAVADPTHVDLLCDAAAALIKDKTLSKKEKWQKLKTIVKLLPNDPELDGDEEEIDVESGTDEDDKEKKTNEDEEEKTKESEDEKDEKDKKADESLRKEVYALKSKLEAYELAEKKRGLEKSCRDLCEKQGLPSAYTTDKFVSLLVETKSEKSRIEYIEDRKSMLGVKTPISKAGTSGEEKLTVESLLKAIED